MTSIKSSININLIKNKTINKTYGHISSEKRLHILMKKLELEENKCKLLQKELDNIKSSKKNSLIKIQKSVLSEKEKNKVKMDDLEKKIKNLYSFINTINYDKHNLYKKNNELIDIIKKLLPKTNISKECKICYNNDINCILPCGHVYCSDCIDKMNIHNNTDCCFCRKNILNVYKL